MKEILPHIGEVINELMAKRSPKAVAFKHAVSRDAIYELKQRWPLFLGWTNEYKRED